MLCYALIATKKSPKERKLPRVEKTFSEQVGIVDMELNFIVKSVALKRIDLTECVLLSFSLFESFFYFWNDYFHCKK